MKKETVKLRHINPNHIVGRTYDWSAINEMIDGGKQSVVYECQSPQEARKAYVSLVHSLDRSDVPAKVSMSGHKLVVSKIDVEKEKEQ